MSGYLAGKVWQSALDRNLKPLAAALADIANDDGTSIFPSVDYMAWILGAGRRSVQTGLAQLREAGILVVVGFETGGRGHATEYRMIEEALPERPSWKEERVQRSKQKGAKSASLLPDEKGANSEDKGCSSEQQRAQNPTQRMQPGSPDPSSNQRAIDPSSKDPEIPPPFKSATFLFALAKYEKNRKELRSKLTPTARELLYKRLLSWGEERASIALLFSAEKGWKGCFEPKSEGDKREYAAKTRETGGASLLGDDFEFEPHSRVG